jgi:GNAT superfamily N-acetyltransferase
MSFITIPLDASYGRESFVCGKSLLDFYIQEQAKQDVKRKLSACFIFADQTIVKAYYTLSAASIDRRLLPQEIIKKLPPAYSDLPVILLGRLAVDRKFQGKGIGEMILMDALKRCYYTSLELGSMAVIVDPLDEEAVKFYRQYDFMLLPDSGKMFLPMGTIAQLFLT